MAASLLRNMILSFRVRGPMSFPPLVLVRDCNVVRRCNGTTSLDVGPGVAGRRGQVRSTRRAGSDRRNDTCRLQ